MFSLFRKAQPLPPAWQPAVGRSDDRAAFEAPQSEPGLIEHLVGFFRGNVPVYVDAPPRVEWLPDPRAARNRAWASERAKQRAGSASRSGSADSGPKVYAVADGPPQALGTAPAPYDFFEHQPDVSPEVKAFYTGVRKRQFGPTYQVYRAVQIQATRRRKNRPPRRSLARNVCH